MNVVGGTAQLHPAGARIRLVIATIAIGLLLAVALVTLRPSEATGPVGGSVPTVTRHYRSGPQGHIGEMAQSRPDR